MSRRDGFTRGAPDFIMPPPRLAGMIRTFRGFPLKTFFQAGILVLQRGAAKFRGIPLGAECNYTRHHRIRTESD